MGLNHIHNVFEAIQKNIKRTPVPKTTAEKTQI